MDQLDILIERKERLESRLKRTKKKGKKPTIIEQAKIAVKKAASHFEFLRSQSPAVAAKAVESIESEQLKLQEQIAALQTRKRYWLDIADNYDSIILEAKEDIGRKERYLERLEKETETETKVEQINTLKSLLLAAGVK